jgi:hypothetical protein
MHYGLWHMGPAASRLGMSSLPPPEKPPPKQPGEAPVSEPQRAPATAIDPNVFAPHSGIRARLLASNTRDLAVEAARLCLRNGENEQALLLLTRLVEAEPQNSDAASLLGECRESVERDCLAAIGSESTVLAVTVTRGELESAGLDPTSRLLLSLVDGASSVGALIGASGLPRLLALGHLRKLVDRGIVSAVSGNRTV